MYSFCEIHWCVFVQEWGVEVVVVKTDEGINISHEFPELRQGFLCIGGVGVTRIAVHCDNRQGEVFRVAFFIIENICSFYVKYKSFHGAVVFVIAVITSSMVANVCVFRAGNSRTENEPSCIPMTYRGVSSDRSIYTSLSLFSGQQCR